MKRRHFLTAFTSAVIVAGLPAQAATFEESVLAQLKAQGYKSITVERTLLGRIKIIAHLKDGQREIILNPRTGEILRDFWMAGGGDPSVPKIRDTTDHSGKGDDGGDNDGDEGDGDNGGNEGSGGDGGDDNSGGDDPDDDDGSDNGGDGADSDDDDGDDDE